MGLTIYEQVVRRPGRWCYVS